MSPSGIHEDDIINWNMMQSHLHIPSGLDHLLIFDCCGAAAAFPRRHTLRKASQLEQQYPWLKVDDAIIDGLVSCGAQESTSDGDLGFTRMISKAMQRFFNKSETSEVPQVTPFTVKELWDMMLSLPGWNERRPQAARSLIRLQTGTRLKIGRYARG